MIRMLCAAFLTFCCVTQVHAKTSWEEYLDLPSENNAKRVTNITYSAASTEISKKHISRDLKILGTQIISGDRAAFQLAFQLREKTDGGLLEDLDAMLGHAVRPYPMLLLEELARKKVPDAAVESIILNPGLEYTDRPAAQLYEIEMRYKSILAIQPSDSDIERVRKECIGILKSDIEQQKLHLSERLKLQNPK